jgi:hypothetical protein
VRRYVSLLDCLDLHHINDHKFLGALQMLL